MELVNTHISYCTNIHGGESWKDHFQELQTYVPLVKKEVSSNSPFGLGLRLSAQASQELCKPDNLFAFKSWLSENDVYVFTMNGFPYGDFHLKSVKDKVHFPDWTTEERLSYTLGMFDVLVQLLPEKGEGGISTSPLSYRHWFNEATEEWLKMRSEATMNILKVAAYLYEKENATGIYMHLDIEPEPDGVLENSNEFVEWYQEELLTLGEYYFKEKWGLDSQQSKALINRYICLCYDVCHFALEYENHEEVMQILENFNIGIGKFQISSALQLELSTNLETREKKKYILQQFNEPIYLHQVIAKKKDNSLVKYRDLDDALPYIDDSDHIEWRSHFHVPIFLENYGEIGSTQKDILDVVRLHIAKGRTQHIEVETYTWGVLPVALQAHIEVSITRELNWLLNQLSNKS